MNLLLINHYAGSPQHGMEYRPYYLAREWVKRGHQVSIVAASRSHVRTVQPQVHDAVQKEIIDGIRYVWIRTPRYEGNGPARFGNMLAFVLRLALWRKRVVGQQQPHVVIASSTYPLDVLAARLIARAHRAQLVFEVHDLWPLSPIELGGMSWWHPFIVLMQCAENFAYRYADVVVSMLPNAEEHMVAHGMEPEKFVHVPNGVDPVQWTESAEPLPQHHQPALSRLKSEGKLIIGYAGAHGLANGLASLIDAAASVGRADVAFVLVGQGPEKPALRSRAEKAGLTNVVFLPSVTREAVPALLETMDVCYIGLKKEPLFRFGVSPNKLMDYMMAGRPIIYAVEAGNDPVADAGAGLSIPSEDPGAIAEAIGQLASLEPSQRVKMGQRGRDYVLKHHDYARLAERFLDAVS